MCKNLSEIATHTKGLRSKVVVPKKHFFSALTVITCGEQVFSGHSVSLFCKSNCDHSFLKDYCIFLEQHLQP